MDDAGRDPNKAIRASYASGVKAGAAAAAACSDFLIGRLASPAHSRFRESRDRANIAAEQEGAMGDDQSEYGDDDFHPMVAQLKAQIAINERYLTFFRHQDRRLHTLQLYWSVAVALLLSATGGLAILSGQWLLRGDKFYRATLETQTLLNTGVVVLICLTIAAASRLVLFRNLRSEVSLLSDINMIEIEDAQRILKAVP